MLGEEKESNGFGGSSLKLMVDNSQAMKYANASGIEMANASGRSAEASGNCVRTYKRRKNSKAEGEDSDNSIGQLTHKPEDGTFFRNSYSQTSVVQVESNGILNDSLSLSENKWRNVALQQIYQSLESEGGLKKCIGDALASHPDAYCAALVKESGNCCNGLTEGTFHSNSMTSDVPAKGNVDTLSTGLINGQNHCTTQRCQRLFSDIMLSEEFSQLCRIIFENFEGAKVDKFLNIGIMHSKMKEGSYEYSPMSFHSDIQEMWSKLHKVGSEILAISKRLSNKSTSNFQSQFVTKEPDTHCRADRPKPCTCKHCGEKADGTDSLVCDSCEEMYHVSCIHPAVEEIPPRSWYCANCTERGIESPHDNCVVCERLIAPREEHADGELMKLEKLVGSSNGLMDDDDDDDEERAQLFDEEPICNVCKTEAKHGEKLQICGHTFCLHKVYHKRCLNRKELNSYGPVWYCPSCLCRSCLTDCDDNQIVICDGCDHAYHLYCMRPPRTSIPAGKWFCENCEAGIQRIRKVKRSYEITENKLKQQRALVRRGGGLHQQKAKDEEGLDKSGGGVDMLLNAAKTLNYEENLAEKTIILNAIT